MPYISGHAHTTATHARTLAQTDAHYQFTHTHIRNSRTKHVIRQILEKLLYFELVMHEKCREN